MKTISANLNIMIKASDKASKVLIRDFGEIENLQVSKKGPKDFVTNSDLKAEKIIIEELKKARPHYSILSEGINVSGLTHCILLRNQSVVSMAQTVGRVIRLHPDDANDIANGVIPRGQLQLYRKPTGYVTIPIHKNHGKRTLTRLQRVVDEIFIQGIPATAYVG